MDRDIQEKLINQLITHWNDIDEDLLKQLNESLTEYLETDNNEDRFIALYRTVKDKIDKLISEQYNCPFDVWEFIWERLFNKGGYIERAYKLHPFNTDIVDSSYQDEVDWIMYNWENSCKAIIERKNKEKLWNNL